jgi:hypothetical protein
MNVSCNLFEIVEDQIAFDPLHSINGQRGKYLRFEHLSQTDDGTFPRLCDWKKFMNRIDKYGISEFLTWVSRKSDRLVSDYDYCTIHRESKFDDEAIIKFKEPIEIIVAYVNDNPITIQADEIHGCFSYEWYWLTNLRTNHANAIEIYFDCQKFFLTSKPLEIKS